MINNIIPLIPVFLFILFVVKFWSSSRRLQSLLFTKPKFLSWHKTEMRSIYMFYV